MKSSAKTVKDYIASLPIDRREAIVAVRKVILDNLPSGYEETMDWGMISYEVPLAYYPDTYNKKPLLYVALASQKNHMAVYMNGLYGVPGLVDTFKKDYQKAGMKLDMGSGCVRFKKLDQLPLALIGEYVAKVDRDTFVAAEKARKS